MARQEINIGVAPTGAGGDTTRSGAVKINAMTAELYPLATGALPRSESGYGGVMPLVNPLDFNWPLTKTATYIGQGTVNGPEAGDFYVEVGYLNDLNMIVTATSITSRNTYIRLKVGGWGSWNKVYTSGNTTKGSGGVLSAASPIVRIANVSQSQRRDLQEQYFESAGAWGVANNEARGVTVERIAVGEYRVVGSLGLAFEGWRTQDPCSPDGGRTLGVTDSQQEADGSVLIRLFKQRWTLTDDGEMIPGRGAPMDVPLNSWIDVRLEMPKAEAPPPIAATED
ncbi:hypothetical protein C4K03_1520 [Pseudomonas synxantha]|uniref:Phage tail protein C-terminal domain-containing protein n=1 Tax=Pseudomonas synxantha TaxID=47883 RepID=A0A3G7U3E4_9PSED|nr:hypothetical protein [Pseudomonas synxantha]AZE53691.1 hypothetical protein C4K03_1520 [Pseudomonas synxantha]